MRGPVFFNERHMSAGIVFEVELDGFACFGMLGGVGNDCSDWSGHDGRM